MVGMLKMWDGTAWKPLGLSTSSSYGAWTAYTPTWGSMALGSGTLNCAYAVFGKTVHFRVQLVFGSGTSFTGTQVLSLPVAVKSGTFPVFFGEAYDVNVGGVWRVSSSIQTSTTTALVIPPTTAGTYDRVINGTTPFTWTTPDRVSISGTYEID